MKIQKLELLLIFLSSSLQSGQLTYPIVDTGQTTFYGNRNEISAPAADEPFYGQDAQIAGYQPSYTDNGDGTITDNVTGLMWTKSPDLNGDGIINARDKLSYRNALAAADTLNLAGHDDWRLPTIKELYSLIMFYGKDPSGYNGSSEGLVPFINTDYFEYGYGDETAGERIIDAQFATSTKYVSTTMNGSETIFGVNFADGRIKGYPSGPMPGRSEDKGFYLLFVRGNPDYGKNDFVDNGDGTISDRATGLMWQQGDSEIGMNWKDALTWVQQKNSENYLGYNDWRLPNVKELHSLVDYTRSPATSNSAAIDTLFTCSVITNEGGVEDYPFYWSSTTHANMVAGSYAAYIAFGRGLGWMEQPPFSGNYNLLDVHGAGCQRSDPKRGDPADWPNGHGPQGDVIRIYNYVRLVRTDSLANLGGNEGPGEDDYEVTLFAPLGQKTTCLINGEGDVVHRWESRTPPALSAYLLKDKSLLRTASPGKNGNAVFGTTGGAGGRVERFDWEGNKIWEFEYSNESYCLHHDVEYLPNGNILMIAWEYKSGEEAIAAGRNPSLLFEDMLWPDKIIEVQPTGSAGGNIVWQWKVWDHLIQDYDATKPDYGIVSDYPGKINLNFVINNPKPDWIHINAVDYNAELDQILLTCRNFSEVWIIDHNTTTEEAAGPAGDLLYRWGNPQAYGRGSRDDQKLFGPHDGHWIENGCPGAGDILIFNNGQGRPDGDYSSVDQITPPLYNGRQYTLGAGSAFGPDSLSWSYQADPPSSFYADHISGAQRLRDGNTLICHGTSGLFFEVSDDGKTVWEYTNPFFFTDPQGRRKNEVFRALRYSLNELDGQPTAVWRKDVQSNSQPVIFHLDQNYPNPFNPVTTIGFSLPATMDVSLRVYNETGRLITTLVNQQLARGFYRYSWNAENYPSGIYFYRLKGRTFSHTRRMLLIK